jgi:hypothetical protein
VEDEAASMVEDESTAPAAAGVPEDEAASMVEDESTAPAAAGVAEDEYTAPAGGKRASSSSSISENFPRVSLTK